jgi:hypothetical protein
VTVLGIPFHTGIKNNSCGLKLLIFILLAPYDWKGKMNTIDGEEAACSCDWLRKVEREHFF